jgi:hypothetical protein
VALRDRALLSRVAALAAACAAACASACNSGPPRACDGTIIERFRELEVVDEAVVQDVAAKNANGGAWSFRHAMEELAPSPGRAGDFVRGWLQAWVASDAVRGPALAAQVVCPWLRATPENACDAACARCAGSALDLSAAPFRLLAISNRIDLGAKPDALSPAGEGRLVFAITDGPGDSPSSAPLDATVILEYALLANQSPANWASTWHSLSAFAQTDGAYRQALAQVTESFVRRTPSGATGLSQLRVNEAAFGPSRVFREFAIDDGGGALVSRGLRNTPRSDLNDSPALRTFVEDHANEVRADLHVLPLSMRAPAIDTSLRWALTGVDEPTRKAFAEGTCNGCHASELPSLDGFHVSPHAKGPAKLSPFVNDPAHTSSDDLARREDFVQQLLCGP